MCLHRVKVHSFLKLIVTLFIGVAIGLLVVGLAAVTDYLRDWKNVTARSIIHDGHPHGIFRAACFHAGYTTAIVLLGSSLVCTGRQQFLLLLYPSRLPRAMAPPAKFSR